MTVFDVLLRTVPSKVIIRDLRYGGTWEGDPFQLPETYEPRDVHELFSEKMSGDVVDLTVI